MTINDINTILNATQESISKSTLDDSKENELKKNVNQFLNNKEQFALVNSYFVKNKLTDSKGLIKTQKLTASESRNITMNAETDATLIAEIKKSIIKNSQNNLKIIEEKKSNILSLESLKLEGEDYTSEKLNTFNYSDFLEGKLEKHIRPKITMIVAYDDDYGIGLNGTLPWHISEDLKFFKAYTNNKVIVMGRTNYDDIAKVTKGKGLPNRTNVVLSRTSREIENFDFHTDVHSILAKYKDEKEIVIIGGTMLYETFMPIADEIIATEIKGKWKTDVKFPMFKDKFICLKTSSQQTEKAGEIFFRRFVRLAPPSASGITTIKGEKVKYDYNEGHFHNCPPDLFINDITSFLDLYSPEIFSSLAEVISNSPLPSEALHSLLEYGQIF